MCVVHSEPGSSLRFVVLGFIHEEPHLHAGTPVEVMNQVSISPGQHIFI